MKGELAIIWKLADGTRCSVLRPAPGLWRLVVLRAERDLLTENFMSPHALLERANQLRLIFERLVA